jgi:hypothetical protein
MPVSTEPEQPPPEAPLLERLSGPLHAALALLATTLVLGSPWLAMVSRLKHNAAWPDLLHVTAGWAAAALLLPYAWHTVGKGRWRLYFPWVAGDLRALRQDLQGLLQGRLPGSEGGGLFATLQGALLLALLAAAGTGLAWWFTQGTSAALDWHGHHTLAARVAAALLGLHLLTGAAHLIEFVRD